MEPPEGSRERSWAYPTLSPTELEGLGMPPVDARRFIDLYERYLGRSADGNHTTSTQETDYDSYTQPSESLFVQYDDIGDCPREKIREYLSKLVIIKLNGGLGTRMGLHAPKSSLELKSGTSFLDLVVRQVEYVNDAFNVKVPLVLMNSFYTDTHTKKLLQKYKDRNVQISTFTQSAFPRLYKESHALVPKKGDKNKDTHWYPPGSGDVFYSFFESGLLQKFVDEGKEWVFISNIENLGGSLGRLHFKLLNAVFNSGRDHEFLMEVVERVSTDTLGGIVAQLPNGSIKAVDLQSVPASALPKLKDVRKFAYWNTNNMWVNLKSLLRHFQEKSMKLDVHALMRSIDGQTYIQLETPAGSAVQNWEKDKATIVVVPRYRFQEIKTTSNLFVLQSNLFKLNLEHGLLFPNPERNFPTLPLVKFDEEHFGRIEDYQRRMPTLPNILDLYHLTVFGNVTFGSDVTLSGTVIIKADQDGCIDVPDHSTFENKIVVGTFAVLNH